MTRLRTIIVAVVGVAVLGGGLAAAVPASAAATASHSGTACSLGYTSTHNSDLIQFKFSQTCGLSYRAWGDWQNAGFHYGTYRKCPGCSSPYSVACAVPSTCGSGGGTLFSGGYQNKSTGHMTCTINCSAVHTTALVLPARVPGPCDQGTVHYGIGIQPGSLSVWWGPDSDSSTTDGCAALWSQVKDNSGNVTTGGRVYYDNGIKSGATARDGGPVRWSKAWMFINGVCQVKTVVSPSGPSGWSVTACP